MELIAALIAIWIVLAMIRLAWNMIVPLACLVGLGMIMQSCSGGARSAPVETVR